MPRTSKSDEIGALAYDPAVLLKVVLFAYSRGITSSRSMAQACVENVIFIALACNQQPRFTTLAHFVAALGKEVEAVFRDVVTRVEKSTHEQIRIRQIDCRMPFGKVLVAIANKHARQRWAMPARNEAYDADAWFKHPMVQRAPGKHAKAVAMA